MVGSPDSTRTYLRPFLFTLVLFIKDARTSFSMIINETNLLNSLYTNHPDTSPDNPNVLNELREYSNKTKNHESVRRVAVLSFANLCGIISNMIWPYAGNPNNTAVYKRKVDRKKHLQEFFPEICYPNLTKNFRNFLEHNDERMDEWNASSQHRNIAIATSGSNPNKNQNLDFWLHFDPSTFNVTYEGSKKVDLNAISRS